MKRNDLYLTREQCQHLQELGLDMSDAAYCHIYELVPKCVDGEYCEAKEWGVKPYDKYLLSMQPKVISVIPTYTLQEIIALLPKHIKSGYCCTEYDLMSDPYHGIGYAEVVCRKAWSDEGYGDLEYHVCYNSDNSLDNAYNLLCWVLKNEHLKEDKK